MQNGQTEAKLYVDTTKALFVHSKKLIKQRKTENFFGFSSLNIKKC